MNWRLASRLSVITLAILVVALIALLQHNASAGTQSQSASTANSSGLQGTDLGTQPAPGFQLTDQYGKAISLAQFKGKPVVLTFLYTHCPDVCPLTAEKLHATMLDLGSDASNVAMLAVSVDPTRDTTQAALDFSKAHQLQNYWHFLTGSDQQLSPIWSSYSVYAQKQQQSMQHDLAVYVIDKQGRERVYLDNDFTSTQLSNNLKILLKEQ